MALKASLIITGISIALLAIYGIDVAIGHNSDDGMGFIPFDHKIRGMVLGSPAMILPIVAFFASRKEDSKLLGIMIIIAGILIVAGGVAVLGMMGGESNMVESSMQEDSEVSLQEGDNDNAQQKTTGGAMSEVFLIVIGAFIVALGIIKIKKSA
jgi:hypothetical protein